MVNPLLVPLIGAGISAGIGALTRWLMGDKNPLEPHEVGLDAALGAVSFGTYGSLSAVGRAIGTNVAKTTGRRILGEAIKWGTTAVVTDVAEDVLRKEIYGSPLNPHEEERKRWQEAPLKIHTETLPYSFLLGATAGALFEGINIGVEKGKIPTLGFKKISSPSGEQKFIGFYSMKGKEAKPLLGIAKEQGGWKFAGRNFEFQSVNEPVPIVHPLERRLFLRAVKEYEKRVYDPSRGIKPDVLDDALRMMDIMESVKVPIKEDLRSVLRKAPRFKGIADDVADWLEKQRGAVVFGSSSQKMHMGTAMRREIHDIDLFIRNPEKKAKELVEFLRKKGIKDVRVNPESPHTVERLINGQWKKILDMHEREQAYSLSLLPQGKEGFIGYGFRTQPPEKAGKIYVMRLSEQGIRKGVSTFTPQRYGFAPEPHRLKDVYDFIEIAKYVEQQLRKEGKTALANELSTLIKRVESGISPQLRARILRQIAGVLEKERFVFYIPETGSYVKPSQVLYALISGRIGYAGVREAKSSYPRGEENTYYKYKKEESSYGKYRKEEQYEQYKKEEESKSGGGYREGDYYPYPYPYPSYYYPAYGFNYFYPYLGYYFYPTYRQNVPSVAGKKPTFGFTVPKLTNKRTVIQKQLLWIRDI
jgi:hypothetical protein